MITAQEARERIDAAVASEAKDILSGLEERILDCIERKEYSFESNVMVIDKVLLGYIVETLETHMYKVEVRETLDGYVLYVDFSWD